MARPLRGLWKVRSYGRRRHRTWMFSMTMASLGWGCWWAALFLAKFADVTPNARTVAIVAALFAAPGILAALVTMRAQKAWLYFAAVPLLANGGLLLLPLLIPENLFGPR